MVSGNAAVTINISGPASSSASGAGRAVTQVNGPPGTYTLTATGDVTVGFFLGYSDTGGTCV
jgi:hypothetical protein